MFKNLRKLEPFRQAEMPNLRGYIRLAIWLPGFALQGLLAYLTLRATVYREITVTGIILLPVMLSWAFIFAANGGFISQGAYEELVERKTAKAVPFGTTNAA
jgi:hypothetical protein